MSTEPYHRTTFQGYTVDERTKSALEWVDRHVHRRIHKHIRMFQGSYHQGVSASAGTHNSGGVVDLHVDGYTIREQHIINNIMRKAGFASWIRPYAPGVWPRHIHACLIGHHVMAPLAKQQVSAYANHRDGLAGNRYDPAWRPKHARVWSHRRKRPVLRRG